MALYVASPASPRESETLRSISSDINESFFIKKHLHSSACPFNLQWSFGMNAKSPVINLTTGRHGIIAYCCSHIVMLYDYRLKEMFPLQGHQNEVKTISTTSDGKFLLSADFGEDCAVVVWDTEIRIPIYTLLNVHGKERISAARISPNAKYIVTVGNEKSQRVHFWLWSYGNESPDASVELIDNHSERVKEINFSEKFPKEFLLTTDFCVIFFTWKQGNLNCCRPKIVDKRFGIFNTSCYASDIKRVLTSTTNGYILVWNTVGSEKQLCKCIQLQKCNITTILTHDRMIITGNSEGRITFYDCELKLLYWCEDCDLDSITSISFDRSTSESTISDPEFERTADDKDGSMDKSTSEVYEDTDAKSWSSSMTLHIENLPKNYSINKHERRTENTKIKSISLATDATLQRAPFTVTSFIVSTSNGIIATLDISKLKCNFILRHDSCNVTCLDSHPENTYIVTGDLKGRLTLYDYQKRKLVIRRSVPEFPDFRAVSKKQIADNKIIYVTCPQNHESLKSITALKYSPKCDLLACGLENGALWILHPIILEPLDEIPYKHSSQSILDITFTKSSDYMAYSDNGLTVAVFKRNPHVSQEGNFWNFVGKYHSHFLPIRSILFCLAAPGAKVPRFLSLGEDQDLIEYDLENSGPYPDPGLKILKRDRIEHTAIPLCFHWYPCETETFFITSNSEYKFRLINDPTRTIRGTFLAPTFGSPVQTFKIIERSSAYMVFATDKEIGLQILPPDGNPYKVVGMVGHPQKIQEFVIGADGETLFTAGRNDPCVLTWKINRSSADVMVRLGGDGLSPFQNLIDGGKDGWLWKEMRDMFRYAQILQQGENTTATRTLSAQVSTKQILNLMCSLGYYPSHEELKNILNEVSYRRYAETGKLLEEIRFEDFVKLYINHRPYCGITEPQIKEAYRICAQFYNAEYYNRANCSLSRGQFLRLLHGIDRNGDLINEGESMTPREAHSYLQILTAQDKINVLQANSHAGHDGVIDFDFLPERISYKDFTANIMGIEYQE